MICKKSSLNDLMNVDNSIPSLSQDKLISVLLYEIDAFDKKINFKVQICTVQFIKNSHRYDDSHLSKSFLLC